MRPEQQTLETWEQKMKRLALELKALEQHQIGAAISMQKVRAYKKKKREVIQHLDRVDDA